MKRHLTAAAFLAGLSAVLSAAQAQSVPRQSFQVATGSTVGTYFPVGELIAGIVSHPPGLPRCDQPGVCGPPGLMVSARTSEGGIANVLAVNAGSVESGLAQSNVVADAVAGRSVFRRAGRQTHIRVVAALFPESVQLVVGTRSHIAKVSDLRGKRVSIGNDGAGVSVVARAILSAYRLSERRLKLRRDSYDVSAALLQRGKIDAFFFLGAAPSPVIGDLIARGAARLVPIDGKARRHLLIRVPSLSADTIPAGAYRGVGTIQTVNCRTLWVVRDSVPPDTVYGLVRALFNPANRERLDSGDRSARYIRLDEATSGLTAPLHPGAARFYRELGRLADPKGRM